MNAAANYIFKLSILGNILRCSRNFSGTNYKYPLLQSFLGQKDRFNGITIDSSSFQCTKEIFIESLDESLKEWALEGRRCIWFKVHIADTVYVPLLAQKGFNFHHARDDFVMMYKWLPLDLKPNLPPACHTNLGVGAFVVNDKSQMLAVSEKHYEYPHWKLPGGYVERGEDIVSAAQREVKEETGVESEFLSLITFRHTHDMMYGNSDIYLLLMMKALSENISMSNREIKECKWMDIEEYIHHPHVHLFNRLIIKQAYNCRDRNIKLDIQKRTVKWATFTRVMDFLHVTEYDR